MKRLVYAAIWLSLFSVTGCGLDNYDEPSSHLTGKVVYQDRILKLSHGKVVLNLYQDGYDKNGPISVYAAQDGTFRHFCLMETIGLKWQTITVLGSIPPRLQLLK